MEEESDSDLTSLLSKDWSPSLRPTHATKIRTAFENYQKKDMNLLKSGIQSIKNSLELDKQILAETRKSLNDFKANGPLAKEKDSSKYTILKPRVEVLRNITKENTAEKLDEAAKNLYDMKLKVAKSNFGTEKVMTCINQFDNTVSSLKISVRNLKGSPKNIEIKDVQTETDYSKLIEEKAKIFLEKLEESKESFMRPMMICRSNPFTRTEKNLEEFSDEIRGDDLKGRTWELEGFDSEEKTQSYEELYESITGKDVSDISESEPEDDDDKPAGKSVFFRTSAFQRGNLENKKQRKKEEDAQEKRRQLEQKVKSIIKKPGWKEIGAAVGVSVKNLYQEIENPESSFNKQKAITRDLESSEEEVAEPKSVLIKWKKKFDKIKNEKTQETSEGNSKELGTNEPQNVRMKWIKQFKENYPEEYYAKEVKKLMATSESEENMLESVEISKNPAEHIENVNNEVELYSQGTASNTDILASEGQKPSTNIALRDNSETQVTKYRGDEEDLMEQYKDALYTAKADMRKAKADIKRLIFRDGEDNIEDAPNVLALQCYEEYGKDNGLEDLVIDDRYKDYYKYLTNFPGWEERYRRVQNKLSARKINLSNSSSELKAEKIAALNEENEQKRKMLDDFVNWTEF